MKTILLAALEYPPMVGGVGEYYRGLVEASEGQIVPFVGQERLYCLPAGKAGKFFPKWLPMLWRIPKEMKKVGADVVFAGEILPIGTALWLLSLLRPALRSLGEGGYGIFLHGLDLALTGRKRWIAKKVMQQATWVIANSENTKKIALGYGIDEKKVLVLTPCPSVGVIRHSGLTRIQSTDPGRGQDDGLPALRNVPSPRVGEGQGEVRILTIARFVERKGYDTAVQVATELKSRGQKFLWTFVGDGPDRKRIESLVDQLDLNDCIRFEHSARGQQLADYYRNADCFVFLPRELPNGDVEGFGMVCLEAALYGLPVVASKSGGVPEAVVDGVTGVLTSPTDVKKIAVDIIALMSDQKKQQAMGEAGRDRVLNEFQWKDRVEWLQKNIA